MTNQFSKGADSERARRLKELDILIDSGRHFSSLNEIARLVGMPRPSLQSGVYRDHVKALVPRLTLTGSKVEQRRIAAALRDLVESNIQPESISAIARIVNTSRSNLVAGKAFREDLKILSTRIPPSSTTAIRRYLKEVEAGGREVPWTLTQAAREIGIDVQSFYSPSNQRLMNKLKKFLTGESCPKKRFE